MATYVGKRIVPVHCGAWDRSKTYEMLSIVLEENSGDSYIARREVPAGTAITDTHYWMLHSLFSQQIRDMSDQLTAAEQRIRADNDETEAAIRADNDATETAILADNQATRAHVDQSLEETTSNLTQRVAAAQTAMTQQKESFDQTALHLNNRMDTVLAAGTGAGETEILDARLDADGIAHETLGEAVRSVGREVQEARTGFAGVPYATLKDAIQSFAEPFSFRRRLKLNNRVVILSGKTSYTRASCEDITDDIGDVRGVRYTAEILREYSFSSFMGQSSISMQDFTDCILGKQMVVQLVSPIAGVVNISVGASTTSGGGVIDDPNGSSLNSEGELHQNSISFNATVREGYNELILNFYQDLPQVQKLMEIATANEWSAVCVSFIPFKWSNVTYVPAVGETYVFELAVCERMPEIEQHSFSVAVDPMVKNAYYAKSASEASHAANADYALASGNAYSSENSQNAGIVPIGDAVHSSHQNLAVAINPLSRIVSVSFDKDCFLTTGQGFSIHLGNVSELMGKTLVLKRMEQEGFEFGVLAINYGANYGNRSYVSVNSAVKEVGDHLFTIDFDQFTEAAVNTGLPVDDTTECWMMIYGNSAWDTASLEEGVTLCNTYQVFAEVPMAYVYSKQIEDMSDKVAELERVRSELSSEVENLRQQVEAMSDSAGAILGQGNVLWGKKWFATGDSFSSGGSVEDDKYFTDEPFQGQIKTYPLFIGRRNNMEVINDSISGSIMALDKKYVADPENVSVRTRSPFSYERYLTIPEDVDYITLWFGINDAGNTNLGTIDDETNETFYGAWNIVMRWILTNRPWAHVGIIITNGASTAYREAERQIARKWGIPYLDMMGDDQVPVMTLGRETSLGLCTEAYNLRRTTFSVGHAPSGDSHPCWQTHEYESTFIEAFLRRL